MSKIKIEKCNIVLAGKIALTFKIPNTESTVKIEGNYSIQPAPEPEHLRGKSEIEPETDYTPTGSKIVFYPRS